MARKRANSRSLLIAAITLLLLLVTLAAPPQTRSDAPFTAVSAGLTGVSWSYVGWGDYDRDGDLDALLTGGQATKVYRNDGGNNFVDIKASLAAGGHQNAEWGDYDGDGDLDILLTGTYLYRNDDGTFREVSTVFPDIAYGAASWGDVDNDGDLDVALSGGDGGSYMSAIYRNDGGGSFTDIDAAIPNVFDGSMAWGDYDGDADLDLLMTGGSSGGGRLSRVYRNVGSAFVNSGITLIGLCHSSAVWGDYDNDGDLDILLSGQISDGSYTMKIYRNSGGKFTDINAAGLSGQHYSTVRWGDYDNDGDLDILQPHETHSRIYRNDSGEFVAISAGLVGAKFGAAAWGDYDNDGDLDVLLTGQDDDGSPMSMLYRNNLNVANPTPSAPDGLAVNVVWPQVEFSWQSANDAQTPPLSLTYNLRLGKTPGGNEVVPPMADPLTGYRYIPAYGNQQLGTTARIDRLAPGAYYWSVQAVDPAFAGSAFSAEGTFAMGTPTPAPTVPPTPTLTPTPDVVPPTGSFTINRGAAKTESVLVRLDIVASDPGGGPLETRLRNDEEAWGPWRSYQPALSWLLPAVDGRAHTVHLELRDAGGNAIALAQSITVRFYPPRPSSAAARLQTDAFGAGERKTSQGYCLGGTTSQVMAPGVLQGTGVHWLAGFWSRLVGSPARAPMAPQVSIRREDTGAVLGWPHVLVDTGGLAMGVARYTVWRAGSPYFVQAGHPFGVAEAPDGGSGTVNFNDSGALGDGLEHYYFVNAVSASCTASGGSNRVGVFPFSLVPGNVG